MTGVLLAVWGACMGQLGGGVEVDWDLGAEASCIGQPSGGCAVDIGDEG